MPPRKKPEVTERGPAHYRCRVECTARFKDDERSVRFGPGSIVSAEERDELVERQVVQPGWFDPIEEVEA